MTSPDNHTVGDIVTRLEFSLSSDALDFQKTGKGVLVVEDGQASLPLPTGPRGPVGHLTKDDKAFLDDRSDAAASSAAAAKTSETNAKSSETKAKTSETNAKTSETKAKASEEASASSATASAESASAADLAKSGAEGAATRAETAEAGAVTARTGSETGQELSEDAAAVAVAASIAVGGLIKAKVIPQNADLDTLIDPGKWIRSGGITDIGNIPIWNADGFSVINYEAGGGRIIQQVSAVNASGIAATWSRVRSYSGFWYPWREHVYKDVLDALYDDLDERVSRVPTEVDASKIVAVGDSQVAAGYSWAYGLDSSPGLTVINEGRSGLTPDEVLLRSGALGIRIPAGVTLQAGVPVTISPDWEIVHIYWAGRTWSGNVDGNPVNLNWNLEESRWELLLWAGHADYTTTDTSMWWSSGHDTNTDARRIVWFGGNAIRNRLSRVGEPPWVSVARSYATAVSVYGPDTIVCGYVPAYGDAEGAGASDSLRDWLGRVLPGQFLDVRHHLQINAATILGRALTAQDEADIQAGWLPRDLYREDGVHLADQTHTWLAGMFAQYPYGPTPEFDLTSSYEPVTRDDLLDTGWRVWHTPATTATLTGGRILIRRAGPMVEVRLDEAKFAESAPSLGAMPVGFRPGNTLSWGMTKSLWPVDGGSIRILGSSGWMNLYGIDTVEPVYFSAMFFTSDHWPSTLPGTPA